MLERRLDDLRLLLCRRISGEDDILSRMAEPDRPFTNEDLKAIEENLARLHESSVKRVYREAWEQCEMKGERLPPAKAVQNLVQV